MKHRTTVSEKKFLRLLYGEFRRPNYMVLSQVDIPPIPGAQKRGRRVDALVVGIWGSRDASIVGFEMKASRQSWLQELKDPRKAEEGAQFCDAWYLLADPGTIMEGELPKNWGLYVSKGDGIQIVKQAEKLSPQEPGRALFFSLLRALVAQSGDHAKESVLRAHYNNGYTVGKSEARKLFREVMHDLRSSVKTDGLEHLNSLLSKGPHDLRAGRIQLTEQFVERFSHWMSLHPTKHALDALEFMAKGGLHGVANKITVLKEQLKGMLSELEKREETITQAAKEAHPLISKESTDSLDQGS